MTLNTAWNIAVIVLGLCMVVRVVLRSRTGVGQCCPHNRCPDRPQFLLHRFRTRPWRCPQCGRWWISRYVAAYDSGDWVWERTRPMEDTRD